jgi:hypothetical protein
MQEERLTNESQNELWKEASDEKDLSENRGIDGRCSAEGRRQIAQ